MSWRGHYGGFNKKFVSASQSSSASTSFSSEKTDLSNVPPPPVLTIGNQPLPPTQKSAFSAAREMELQKEQEYANLMAYGAKTEKQARKKQLYEDEYLEGDHSDEEAPAQSEKPAAGANDEEDELDAFMAGINEQASKDKAEAEVKEKDRAIGKDTKKDVKGIGRADIDEEDMQESYFKYMEEHKERLGAEEEEYEYDEDGNIVWTWKKVIDPLPTIDHSQIDYAPFPKNFYVEHEDIARLHLMDVIKLREKLSLRVGGLNPPKPVCSFAHFSFDKALLEAIRKSEFEHPTPIQSLAIPAALSGRDVLGIAKTGSGKTAAYLWPAIVHIMHQSDLKEDEGPIALIVVPTRELAIQVYTEAKRFCKVYNINVVCAYGGGSKWEQANELKNEGAELVICTPGRIIDLVKMEATNFLRTTFLVFDEADRMFDMGFEAQVKSISDHVRSDRQCLMFSATFKQKVERLARDALCDPVRIVQGEIGEANADVEQKMLLMSNQEAKWNWLTSNLVKFASLGKVLIFVTKKLDSEEVARKLKLRDFNLVLLHGDMLQAERNEHLLLFRKNIQIMVATDVAARGLDIAEIRTVINYDMARDIDTHVHRIGRTGRAGNKGTAYTLFTDKDAEMAGHLVKNLESVGQDVPQELMKLALKTPHFQAQRQSGGFSSGPQQRLGLGYHPKTRADRSDKNLDPLREQKSSTHKKSVHDIVQSAASSSSSSSSGTSPGNARMSILKSAFKQSFQSTFQKPKSEESFLPQQVASDPRPEWKRKIDELNARFTQQRPQQPAEAPQETEQPKKKSRWE
ncbi:unnamed protein product [Caenorhabditis auriculariae]|uniref:RNA helicase n=1 Tax=Caenorhabditis auriculariae TaxID=2777116 RepID=A0A8S1GY34_9PELO|nr:unnamed protein product [Caenorhabditis auriculariae]